MYFLREDRIVNIDEWLLSDYENMEFWYDEREIMKMLHHYLIQCGQLLPMPEKFSGEIDYKNILYIWIRNLYGYGKEAFNNLLVGNMYSYATINRTLIENYIYFLYIHKYREEELWKDWYIYSQITIMQSYQLADREQLQNMLENMLEDMIRDMGEDPDRYLKDRRIRDNAWLVKVFPGKKVSDINMYVLCSHIHKPDLYKEYQVLCNFTHGQNFYIKSNPFTFYNSIIYMMTLLLECLTDACKLYFEDGRADILEEIQITIYDIIEKEGWCNTVDVFSLLTE